MEATVFIGPEGQTLQNAGHIVMGADEYKSIVTVLNATVTVMKAIQSFSRFDVELGIAPELCPES